MRKTRNPDIAKPTVHTYRGVTFEVVEEESPYSGNASWQAWALGVGNLASVGYLARSADPRKDAVAAAKRKIAQDPTLRDEQAAYVERNRDFLAHRAGAGGGGDALKRYDLATHRRRRQAYLDRIASAGSKERQRRAADWEKYSQDEGPGPEWDGWTNSTSRKRNPRSGRRRARRNGAGGILIARRAEEKLRGNPHIPTGSAILAEGGVLHGTAPIGAHVTVSPYRPAVGPGSYAVIVHGAQGGGEAHFASPQAAMRAFSLTVGKPNAYRAIQDWQIRQDAVRVGVQARGGRSRKR